jgi:hypothetical protein
VRPVAEKWVNRRRKPGEKPQKPRKALAVHNLSAVFYHFLSVKNGVDRRARMINGINAFEFRITPTVNQSTNKSG